MNLKLCDITSILEKAVECVEYYKNEWLNNKVFTLYLSNGEKVKFSIAPQNVPHLLGIDLYSLRGIINLTSSDPLEMIKELLSRDYELYNKFKCGVLKESDVFSDHIQDKINNFKNNITGNVVKILEETIFVCQYKSERSWDITTNNQKYDYILVRKLDNGKIGILCLVKNKNQCYAMSNRVPGDEISLDNFFSENIKNQEITLLSGINMHNILNDSEFSKSLYSDQKISKYRVLKPYRERYNCHIDISSDYEYAIGKLCNNRYEKLENKNIIEMIVESIANRELINTDEIDDFMLLNIVNAWNDHVCKVGSNISDDVKISYTTAIEELKTFKSLVSQLEEKNRTLEANVDELTKTNEQLVKETEEQKQVIANVYEIVKPRTN